MKASPPTFVLIGSGVALPERVITNDYFSKDLKLDTSDAWISERTGIRERRIVSEDQTTASLSIDAATQALEHAGLSPDAIDLIIVATITPDSLTPATASYVQEAIGARNACTFDINNACAGFIYAMDIAARFLTEDKYHTALVIGADVASRVIDYQSRSNCYFFGDGAGAIIMQKSDDRRGLLASHLESYPKTDTVFLRGGGLQNILTRQGPSFLSMDGRAVKEFAISAFCRMIRKSCEQAKMAIDDLDAIIPHQANLRILEKGAADLGIPMAKVFVNLERLGNTMSASTAIALHEYLTTKAQPEQNIALVAFGAGLTSAGCILRI